MIHERMIPLAPDRPFIAEPLAEDIDYLQERIALIEEGKESARAIARYAVWAGFMLIGTTVSKPVHRPADIANHRYKDLKTNEFKALMEGADQQMLRAGKNPDIAILAGLFGDLNDRQQIEERCNPHVTRGRATYGWGTDIYKTYREGIIEQEEAQVRTHTWPELINAACDPDKPFRGAIDCVLDDVRFVRVDHDIAQFLAPIERETIFSIPLVGYHDLPHDIIATDYSNTDRMAL